MRLRSTYFPSQQVARLRRLAERLGRSQSSLLREALDEMLLRFDR